VTPKQAIADLDASLKDDGEPIRLQRLTPAQNNDLGAGGGDVLGAGSGDVIGAGMFEVTCQAHVRRYQPHELVGGITQQDSKLILSPTEIIAAGWTSGRPAYDDQRVPMKGNRVFIGGRPCNVEAAAGIRMAGELVRIEAMVRG